MSKDLKNIEQIDDYLSHSLGQEARNEFEEKLHQDTEMQNELDNVRQVVDAVRGFALKEKLKDIHQELFSDEEESSKNV